MKNALLFLFTLTFVLTTGSADTRPAPEDRGASGLALSLRRLQTIASALHTAAHPDDESTELLAYLARGTGARVAYLSLNRGEGGQNGIGPELGDGLGVIRTEELLAARKLDGAEQYFTRAFDFGFTLSAAETLRKWNREEVLGDMVRVIRKMRPLVVISGFTGDSGGHGQHQVAGLLTPEAIKAAADPQRFPEQLTREGLQPWQVLKLYGRRFTQVSGPRAEFDVGVFDPVLGRSPAELANEGRSRHRSQDFGRIQARGSQRQVFPRLQCLINVPEIEPSLFTGIDVSVTGIAEFAPQAKERMLPGLRKIKELAAKALAEYRIEQPEAIGIYLAEGLREVRALRAATGTLDAITRATVDGMLARKEKDFSNALIKAHGVVVDALSNTEIATPGETIEVRTNIYFRSILSGEEGAKRISPKVTLVTPAGWRVESESLETQPAGTAGMRGGERPNHVARFRAIAPQSAVPTQPYWLTKPRTRDQYDWDESMPRTLPFGPALMHARVELELSGERVTLDQDVEYRFSDKTFGEIRRELKVAPALTLTVNPYLLIIPSENRGTAREISVEITHNARQPTSGSVKLRAPQGWKVESGNQSLEFTRQGEKRSRLFKVIPPAGVNGTFELKAVAEANGQEYTTGYSVISYPHIETHFLYRPATTSVEIFDVKVASRLKVGYVMGSGDDGPQALTQLGVDVKVIGPVELASADLSVYDTIILGIRVYEVNEDVIANNNRLLEYVSNGGTLIVQYNKDEFARGNFAPYPVKMPRGVRVTDENAPITVLAPDHRLFNYPNKISEKDWQGWVQERGLYFLGDWDTHFTPLLAAPDESGELLKGGHLIAQYGKGNYIYTGYAWFRQFPAGVPGAYRLFANMVSLPAKK
jgi:LmbE family N-acetylglucosaminyl deacetylase